MEIINKEAIKKFCKKHPAARISRWMQVVEAATWINILEIQRVFKSAEDVKGYVVFNIHGNDFRLIAVVRYSGKQIIIHEIFTHAEYDRWKP